MPDLEPAEAWARLVEARVARLASVRPDGAPHLVPVTFAVVGSVLYSAVDAKPKRSVALQRLTNIASDPRVSVLVDFYSEDWSLLWWVRADGRASVVDGHDVGLTALAAKYPQYVAAPPGGPVLVVVIDGIRGWASS